MVRAGRSFIRIRGLPFHATCDDIADVLQDFRVSPEDVHLQIHMSGPKVGEADGQAYIHVSSARLAERCIAEMNKCSMGGRYLELFQSDEEEFEFKRARGAVLAGGQLADGETPIPQRKHNAPHGGKSGILRVRGLPFSTTAGGLADLFRKFQVSARDVFLWVVTRGPKRGMPDGRAFVKFSTAQLAKHCLEKMNGCTIEGRYLELYPSDQAEFDQVVSDGGIQEGQPRRAIPGAPVRSNLVNSDIGARAPPTRRQQQPNKPVSIPACRTDGVVRVRGVPFDSTAEDMAEILAEYEVSSEDVFMCLLPSGRSDGQCLIRFPTELAANEVVDTRQNMEMGSRYLEFFKSSEADLQDRIERGQTEKTEYGTTGAEFGYLRLRGLPFHVTDNDVVDFFADYQVQRRDVTLERRASDNRLTGQCFVKLNGEETARDAMTDLNRACIGDRYIEIFPSSHLEANRRQGIRASPY